MLAKDIMTKNVITVSKEALISDVVELLIKNDISGVPVVDDKKLIGILSEGDLIIKSKKFHLPVYFTILDSYIFLEKPSIIKEQLEKISAYKVESMMTKKVISCSEEDDIEKIATLMSEYEVNRLPVIDEDNNILGIITRKDIIKSYMKKDS